MASGGSYPLEDWRQGDLALIDCELPLLSQENGEPVVIFTAGTHVAVISQSCDIVRAVEERPYVQIAALMPANQDEMGAAKTGARPRYGYIAALEEMGLVVDFDVTATIDKDAVALWERTPGCANDNERRDFASALARHRQRFAFPDNFNAVVKPVRRLIESKRSKNSPAGEFVRALREIRVTCDDWDNPTRLLFDFYVEAHPAAEAQKGWDEQLEAIREKLISDAFPKPEVRLVTYDDVSAREYLTADRLDLDGLSDA